MGQRHPPVRAVIVIMLTVTAAPSRPFLVAQLTDCHVGAAWAIGGDPLVELRRTVAEVKRLPAPPDIVVVTGDVTDSGAESECELAAEALSQLDMPVHVLPGNHDRRGPLRARFGLPGSGDEPVRYALEAGPMQLVVLDTTIPDQPAGRLDAEQLDWLERQLSQTAPRPTLLAMHHPPLSTGMPPWDELGLAAEDRRALGEVVQRHPHVRRIVGGHLHRSMIASLAGCAVLAGPSIYGQAVPAFGAAEIQVAAGPPGFALHALVDADFVSYLVSLGASA